MPEQRLFFALWPDDAVRRRVAKLARQLPVHGGRTLHPDDFHITLVFLGQVGAERLACVERAADAIRGEPFTLCLDRIGFWPRPRILWLGSDEAPIPLRGLVKGLQQGLSGCGFTPEKRPYAPHVTLARKARKIILPTLNAPLRWPVERFVLAGPASGSDESPRRYQVLKHWSLG